MATYKDIKIGDSNYRIEYNVNTAYNILDKIIEWMRHSDHYASSHGEGILQDDNCQIDASYLIAEIVDKLLQPELLNNE